ncbi:MAG: hypothetical protein FWF41_04880 [Betaproteobacteria bacterium]|nr:hypothetical protein [Betaproteobacteria bacterium]
MFVKTLLCLVVLCGATAANATEPANLDGLQLGELRDVQAVRGEWERSVFGVKDWSDSLGDGVVLQASLSVEREPVAKESDRDTTNNGGQQRVNKFWRNGKCSQEYFHQRLECIGIHPALAFLIPFAFYGIWGGLGIFLGQRIYWFAVKQIRKARNRKRPEN